MGRKGVLFEEKPQVNECSSFASIFVLGFILIGTIKVYLSRYS
jgi:preprotein translocase subunit Sss1